MRLRRLAALGVLAPTMAEAESVARPIVGEFLTSKPSGEHAA
jgi:hypothetical protein